MIGTARRQDQASTAFEVRRNQAGQRIGRKGQETRERILIAALHLLDDPYGPPLTLSGVAREAAMRVSNLYLYFPDLIELLLAVLGRVMDDAEGAFLDKLKVRWPDDQLGEASADFLRAHHGFWKKHARLLQLRNTLSDSEPRIMDYRDRATRPIIRYLMAQMDGCDDADFSCANLAIVILTGFERIATIVTNPNFAAMVRAHNRQSEDGVIEELICAEARVLELTLRDRRQARRDGAPQPL